MAELLGALLMPPDVFWRLTLAELQAIIDGRLGKTNGGAAMSGQDLTSLMRRYPDPAALNPGA